jgi:EamA domain-containing membrane protein RarD
MTFGNCVGLFSYTSTMLTQNIGPFFIGHSLKNTPSICYLHIMFSLQIYLFSIHYFLYYGRSSYVHGRQENI